MKAIERIHAVARKELRILVRDRFYLFMAIGLPVLTMVIMGYGINYDVKGLTLGVTDLDQSVESRRFVDAFTASGYFRIVVATPRPADLDRALEAGRIRVAVLIPAGFLRTLNRGRPAEAQILVDGSLPTRAEIARSYAAAVVARFNEERLGTVARRLPADTPRPAPGLEVVGRVWYNPALESKNFLVPGVLVLSVLFWAPVLVSLSVTREKETGAILNVQTVPLARWEYVIGKLVPYAGISFISYWLLVLAAIVLFRVPVKGSIVVLTLGAFVYVAGMTALGLLVSMLVRTQVAALLTTAVISMAVGLFYSGWLEPLSTLDESGRALGRLLPTADFMALTRGVFLKGLGMGAYRGTLGVLTGYALVFALLSVLGFRKRRR